MAILLDGKKVAARWKEEIRDEIQNLGYQPKLAVILIGEHPASEIYVRNKAKDCDECRIAYEDFRFPSDCDIRDILKTITTLNNKPEYNGILVQLPVPDHLDMITVMNRVSRKKDVDGFSPMNIGLRCYGQMNPIPCTPKGILRLLGAYGITVRGKRCVMVGRSTIVGKPMADILTYMDATVTLCHSQTKDLASYTQGADIVITATGQLDLIDASMVSKDAVVIDVAMNRNESGMLCGDCAWDVEHKVKYITPVPGGVGPMTRAALMHNVLLCSKMQRGLV